jgi:hypothetical protein
MYWTVVSVKALEDYRLELVFETKEKKIFDMKPYLNSGVFKKLKSKSVFNRVKASFDSIEWPGEIDIDPETLYEDGVSIESNLI